MAGRQHALGRLLRHQKAAEGADDERLLDLGRIEFDERTAGAIARVVDDDIGRAERAFDIGEELCDVGVLGRIAGKGFAADLFGKRREIVGAARRQRHLHARFRESARHRGGKPAADPDNERRSIRQLGHAALHFRPKVPGADMSGQYAPASSTRNVLCVSVNQRRRWR